MTKLAACYAGRETIVADGDFLVHILIGKSIRALCHGADKHAYALLVPKVLNIVAYLDDRCIPAQCDFPTVRGQVVSNGVLDDLEKFFLGIGRADGKTMEELHHQPGKPFERPWDADGRRNLN